MPYLRGYDTGPGTEADSFAGINDTAYGESVDMHEAWYEHRFFAGETL